MEAPAIRMTGVRKAFGDNQVLRGLTLDAPRRQSTVIIGGSGTGKSVCLKCVLGIIRPDAGEITVNGIDAVAARGAERAALLDKFSMLFQGAALFDSLPVWRNVAFRKLHGAGRLSESDARDLAVEKLRRVGLEADTANRFPAELSGGMQKRVGLARAIACNPEIIFFDEPTTGLDPIMAEVINELIRDLVEDLGATALTITHDMGSVRRIADRVAMLHNGKIRWQGPVEEMDDSGDPYVTQFIHGRTEGPIETLR